MHIRAVYSCALTDIILLFLFEWGWRKETKIELTRERQIAHIVIVAFIIFGNIAFFLERQRSKKKF